MKVGQHSNNLLSQVFVTLFNIANVLLNTATNCPRRCWGEVTLHTTYFHVLFLDIEQTVRCTNQKIQNLRIALSVL